MLQEFHFILKKVSDRVLKKTAQEVEQTAVAKATASRCAQRRVPGNLLNHPSGMPSPAPSPRTQQPALQPIPRRVTALSSTNVKCKADAHLMQKILCCSMCCIHLISLWLLHCKCTRVATQLRAWHALKVMGASQAEASPCSDGWMRRSISRLHKEAGRTLWDTPGCNH